MNVTRFPKKISEVVVRFTAAEVFILSVIAVVAGSPWVPLFLAFDFALRAFIFPRWSPLGMGARIVASTLGTAERKNVFFSPKRFAAAIGFSLSAIGFVLGFSGYTAGLIAAMGVLAVFSGLEAFAGFCAGCKMYGWFIRWGVIPVEKCPDCV